MILADVLLAVVGGVLVAELKSFAQAPAAWVVTVACSEGTGSWVVAASLGCETSSLDIRPSGESDPKVDTVSQLVSGEGHFFESGVQKDVQGAQFASLNDCKG